VIKLIWHKTASPRYRCARGRFSCIRQVAHVHPHLVRTQVNSYPAQFVPNQLVPKLCQLVQTIASGHSLSEMYGSTQVSNVMSPFKAQVFQVKMSKRNTKATKRGFYWQQTAHWFNATLRHCSRRSNCSTFYRMWCGHDGRITMNSRFTATLEL